MAMIVFDIETGPLPEERLKAVYKPPKPDAKLVAAARPFDPAAVKYGQMKDETKKAAKLAECRVKHAASQAVALESLKQNAIDAWEEFVGGAALSAITGQVLAIGYRWGDKRWIKSGDEAGILKDFWVGVQRCREKKLLLVGHNTHDFDLPFIVHRSWMLGVTIPAGVLLSGGRFWDNLFVDTMQHWRCGRYAQKYTSLDTLAKAFSVGGKPDDCDGAMFHKLWASGKPEDRATAERYLLNDLDMTWAVAAKLGIA